MALGLGESATTGGFGTLATQMPVANQQVAQGLQQARVTQLQQQIGGMPAGATGTPQAAQGLGAQQAQQAGQINLNARQTAMNQQQQIGQLAVHQTQMDTQAATAARSLQNSQTQRQLTTQLAQIDTNLKNKLFDANLQFQKDETGRTLFNERQLADYAVSKAKSDNDLKNYEQQVTQASQRRMTMLQMSYQKIRQTMTEGFTETQQQLTDAQKQQMTQAMQDLQLKIAQEKAKQQNRAAMFSGIGTIAGGVAGAFAGGPAGAGVGAGAGGALGSVFASQQAQGGAPTGT